MKTLLLSFLFCALFATSANSVYTFQVKDITGDKVSLDQYKGKVILIVNTASKCGYTPQYEDLENLYNTYKNEGLVVLGFPANNFGNQEPGTNEEIAAFCTEKFDVSFPMFSKVSVKGDDQDPLFAFLTSENNNDFKGEIKWNFEKFLISKDGTLIRRFRSNVSPTSKEIVDSVKKELSK